jgi:hypothetical protein
MSLTNAMELIASSTTRPKLGAAAGIALGGTL